MNTIILTGSGHTGSTSRRLADRLAQKLGAAQIVETCTAHINACLGCEYCLAHQGVCVIEDGMTALYGALAAADQLIIITPVYFSGLPSTLKAVIDRCQLFYNLSDKSAVRSKRFGVLFLGGAPAYADQTTGIDPVFRIWLPNLKAKTVFSHTFTRTDKRNILEEKQTDTVLDALAAAVSRN